VIAPVVQRRRTRSDPGHEALDARSERRRGRLAGISLDGHEHRASAPRGLDGCDMPRLCGIGGLVAADERKRAKVELDLPLVFSHTALPSDWRTRAQIEARLDTFGLPE
jgi:hypothetical protein